MNKRVEWQLGTIPAMMIIVKMMTRMKAGHGKMVYCGNSNDGDANDFNEVISRF